MESSRLEEVAYRFRWQIAFILVGLILSAGGLFIMLNTESSKFEVLTDQAPNGIGGPSELIVEISGAVAMPGVYTLGAGARVEDALKAAGGFTPEANSSWVDRSLNRAAFVVDGQKLYIPTLDEQTNAASDNNSLGDNTGSAVLGGSHGGLVNINTASVSELDVLWGIGPATAQSIIDQRPYSTVDELLARKIIKSNVYERNKDLLTVY